jgi:exodeoxyribonuclease VII large subunit
VGENLLSQLGDGVYSVSRLTGELKSHLNLNYSKITVEGEVSGFKVSPSGHAYFSMKDQDSLISCVIWRSALARMKVKPREGQQIRARGGLDIYPPRGSYQLIVRSIEDAGEGDLRRRFEEMKQRLADEGLFDEQHKKPVPPFPQCVGVVTSPTGAAIRDFLQVVRQRYPALKVQLVPSAVQGKAAAGEIAAGIRLLNRLAEVDVIIVMRGGGSLEDLWCFNEEVVARAVFESDIPVISAVGHEIDFSICDFTADLRVPTPTGAGNWVVQHQEEKRQTLIHLKERIVRAMDNRIAMARERLERLRDGIEMRSPLHRVTFMRQNLDRLLASMAESVSAHVTKETSRLQLLRQRINSETRRCLVERRHRLDLVEGSLAALNPREVLNRGFSVCVDEESGKVLRSPDETAHGRRLRIDMARGTLSARVEKE